MTLDANSGTAGKKPLVSVLATGGTVAGKAAERTSVVNYQPGVETAESLLASVDGLSAVADIRCRQVANIGSKSMSEAVWLKLAAAAAEELADPAVTGVVVLHGTDTQEETACFLDLAALPGIREKSVVLTGAMRPASALSADGPRNMLNAARVAVCPGSAGRGVLLAFNDLVHLARRVYKSDSMYVNAFSSAGGGAEGCIVDDGVCYYRPASAVPAQAHFSLADVDELPRVEIVYGHAGQSRVIVDAALASGARGVVHAGTGMGNVHEDVRPTLTDAAATGIAVVCSSRIDGGRSPMTTLKQKNRFIYRLGPFESAESAHSAAVGLDRNAGRCNDSGAV